MRNTDHSHSFWQTFFFQIQNQKFFFALFLISLLSSLRILLLPLGGDEITYTEISKNILFKGSYSLYGIPSTITPSMPFIISLFYSKAYPIIGISLARLFNLGLLLIGLRYLYLFLKNLKLETSIIWLIITLTFVNNNLILFSLLLYPESLIFCFFWIHIYFLTKKKIDFNDLLIIVSTLVILTLTRYLFAILGVITVIIIYNYSRNLIMNSRWYRLIKLFSYFLIISLPIIFWMKYVYSIEKELDTGLNYFSRFRNNSYLDNIKAGLGYSKLSDVDNTNGLPALISLFIPKIGFRSALLSIILIITILTGLLSRIKINSYKILLSSVILIMAGLIFAGTGFSRYWLPLLPIFILGIYLFTLKLKINHSHLLIIAKVIGTIYVINEIRLDLLVLNL